MPVPSIGCADHRNVRDWPIERGVACTERKVTGEEDAANDLLTIGIFATPLVVVGDVKMLGFRPDTLAVLALGR